MKVGAHVSTAGGVDKAIDRAHEMGAEAIQIFISSPRGWAFKPIPEAVASVFREKAASAGIGPIFFHGIYLVSLGAPTEENLAKSVQALTDYMQAAEQLGAAGVIFHTGSHREQRRHGRPHLLQVPGDRPAYEGTGESKCEGLPGYSAPLRRRIRYHSQGRP